MRISVFGLGYVGVVTAACMAHEQHDIVGVDKLSIKVDMLNAGRTPIIEDQIGELVSTAVSDGRLRATDDTGEAISNTDLAIVCVGTPSRSDGSVNTCDVGQVIDEIGTALRSHDRPFHVVMRSTMLPGTMRELIVPRFERAIGRPIGANCSVTFHPEFLREGTSVHDFYNPPKIVVGECVPRTGSVVLDLYDHKFDAPRIVCEVEVAEMVKYCDNLYHAVKITFANEIGQFCHAHGIDAQRVMDIFCQDVKLNISSKYLNPGFAFGGSCLPKDARAFLFAARSRHLSLPMLEGVLPSNAQQIERAVKLVMATDAKQIGIHGIAFKPGTDDLRESPVVELAERLLGKGRKLTVFDAQVHLSRLVGGNKSYVEQKFPHLADLLTHRIEDLDGCELVVTGQAADAERVNRWLETGVKVLDLSGRPSSFRADGFTTIV